jgi:hypothetical protein
VGIDLGALIQAGTTAAGGIATGLGERKRLEQQALHQRLADELLKAQTEYYLHRATQAPALKPGQQGKYVPHYNEDGTVDYVYQPGPGEAPPGMTPPVPAAPATAAGQAPAPPPAKPPVVHGPGRVGAKPQRPIVGYDAAGNMVLVTPPKAGAPATTQAVPDVGKPVTQVERKAAGDAQVAQSDHDALAQLEGDPSVLREVAAFIAVPAVGKLVPGSAGGAISNIIRSARSAGLSERAQAYLKRLYDYASLVGPSRYGRRFGSEILLEQLWNEYGAGQFGIAGGGIAATHANRLNGIRALRAQAGKRAQTTVASEFPQDSSAAAVPPAAIDPRFDPRKKKP